jgi:hypothetical protein
MENEVFIDRTKRKGTKGSRNEGIFSTIREEGHACAYLFAVERYYMDDSAFDRVNSIGVV